MSQLYNNEKLYVFLHSSREKSLYYDIDTLTTEYEILVHEEDEFKFGKSLPYLIKVNIDDLSFVRILENKVLMKDAFFIKSTEDITTLADRFKVLFKLRNEIGEEYYFTFYVASIFKMFLNYLKRHRPSMLHILLENITMIYLPKYTRDNKSKLIYYMCNDTDSFLEGTSYKNNNSIRLIYDQTMQNYFSSYKTEEFILNIYTELKIQYPSRPKATENREEVMQWFYNLIKEAREYGVTEEDSVANLLKASWVTNQSLISLNMNSKQYLENNEISAYHKSKELLSQVLKALGRDCDG
jgi:hypothetical protein